MSRRVLLIHPLQQDYWFSDTPHAGLAQLAAILGQAGHEVRVIDYVLWGKHHPTDEDIVAMAAEFRPEVVGFSMYTAVASKTFQLIEALRHLDAPILVGGPHCSLNYDRLRLDERLDYVFKGEAEGSIAEVVAGTEKQDLPVVVESRPFDLDSLPHPDFSVFVNHQNMTAYPLITSRGCQYQCSFCVVSQVTNRRWRPRSLDLVIEECASRIGLYPQVRSVVIADDNPLCDRRRFKTFLRRYAALGLRTLLSVANTRADTLDREMVELLKAANCQAICLGVESADPEVFEHVNKGETLEDIRRAAGMIKDAGLSLGMCFVIGLPHDTWERHQKSVAFARELAPDYVYWNVLHPMKDSEVYRWFMRRGITIQDDTDYTSHSDLTWETKDPLVGTPEFTARERKKARCYGVVETDQYVPHPHLLDRFVARAREYALEDSAVASLRRMRAKHPDIASQLQQAIAKLEDEEAAATTQATSDRPTGPEPDERPPIGEWLAERLFGQPITPRNLLERFLHLYPQAPGLAFWRAMEAEALTQLEFPEPILDLGCGDGTLAHALLDGRRLACGLDVDTVNFPKARALGVYDRLATYDGVSMPFDEHTFGSILANSVLEHVENLEVVLRECARVLRPGGKLVLTVPVQAYDELLYFAQLARADGDNAAASGHVSYHRNSSHHVNWWPAEEWESLLRRVGFDVAATRAYVHQTSAWVFDILKTLGDQGVWTDEPEDGARGFQARFDRLLLERVLDEVVAAERHARGPAAGLLLEAVATKTGGPPVLRSRSREPVADASIYDSPESFSKTAGDQGAYQPILARLTRDGLEHVACYMCGADEPRPVGEKEGLQVVSCGRCGFFYVNPRIPADKLPELYDRSYWYERMKLHGYPDIERRAGHDYRLAVARWEVIGTKVPSGCYLDIGCSNGAMVKRADELGYEAYGLEIDPEVAELARGATGRPVFEGPLREQRFARGEFDLITMHDILEHLYDPRTELREIKRVLAPEGLLVMETFRRDCPQFEAGLADMSHDDIKPGEHVYMYRQEEIHRLLAEAGLAVRAVGYPDGPDNSRLLLHVGHAPVSASVDVSAGRRRGGKRKQRKARRRARTAVSVIIPTHNRAEVLARTLRGYAEQTAPPAEVIVIDDGSTDDTPTAVRSVPGLRIVFHQQENAGPAAARNWALRRARGEIVLITGDDIVPDPDLIERHVEAHRRRPQPNVAVVGRIEWSDEQRVTYFMDYITGEGGQQFNFAELDQLDHENLPAGWFLTSNISLKRRWLAETGELFHEGFPNAAYEDIELGIRLQTAHGLRISYAPHAVGRHLHPQTYESFASRQYTAGRAAATLIELRPELADHFLTGNVDARWREAEAALPEHERAIAGCEARLARGERLEDGQRAGLNEHYAAALETHHLRGLMHGLNGEDGAAEPVAATSERSASAGARVTDDEGRRQSG